MLIKCPECHRDVSDAAPSCPGCGYVLKRDAGPIDLTTQDRILIEQRITNEAPSPPVAYLLWFFLGLVSAHRFYLGRPGSAVLQILSYFVLIGFLWWLIDAFLIMEMIRTDREKLRQRLTLEAGGQLPANLYRNQSSYYDPNANAV